MASSNNTIWAQDFSANPAGEAQAELPLAELVGVIGRERVAYPPGGDAAVPMTRCEALARTLWTRGVLDGDMTAIKLLVELLAGKSPADETGRTLIHADDMALAEALVRAAVGDEYDG
jgi:hypothetical protein